MELLGNLSLRRLRLIAFGILVRNGAFPILRKEKQVLDRAGRNMEVHVIIIAINLNISLMLAGVGHMEDGANLPLVG